MLKNIRHRNASTAKITIHFNNKLPRVLDERFNNRICHTTHYFGFVNFPIDDTNRHGNANYTIMWDGNFTEYNYTKQFSVKNGKSQYNMIFQIPSVHILIDGWRKIQILQTAPPPEIRYNTRHIRPDPTLYNALQKSQRKHATRAAHTPDTNTPLNIEAALQHHRTSAPVHHFTTTTTKTVTTITTPNGSYKKMTVTHSPATQTHTAPDPDAITRDPIYAPTPIELKGKPKSRLSGATPATAIRKTQRIIKEYPNHPNNKK